MTLTLYRFSSAALLELTVKFGLTWDCFSVNQLGVETSAPPTAFVTVAVNFLNVLQVVGVNESVNGRVMVPSTPSSYLTS